MKINYFLICYFLIEDLKQNFESKFFPITDCVIMIDKNINHWFGFVTWKKDENKVLKLNLIIFAEKSWI